MFELKELKKIDKVQLPEINKRSANKNEFSTTRMEYK